MKRFHKFMDAYDDTPIYIDLNSVTSFKESKPQPNQNLSSSSYTISPPTPGTYIYTVGSSFVVTAHIAEVVAIMEGRSVLPAKLLFKQDMTNEDDKE